MVVSVQCEHLHTILYNPFIIGVCIGLGIRQCEHTIKSLHSIRFTSDGEQPVFRLR